MIYIIYIQISYCIALLYVVYIIQECKYRFMRVTKKLSCDTNKKWKYNNLQSYQSKMLNTKPIRAVK